MPYQVLRHRRALRPQEGVALLLSLCALLVLSAIGIGLIFMTDSDTVVGADYRDSQRAYFEAKAGLEEAKARFAAGDVQVIPTAMPTASNGQVFYIINKRDSSEVIEPWTPGNAYFDTELCHENLYASGTLANPGNALVSCTSVPSGNWYTPRTSTGPNAGTSAALNYKWVRVTLKSNGSGAPGNSTSGYVDPSKPANVQVCWNGTTQTTLPGGSTCEDTSGYYSVYVATALAVTRSGSRRMVQSEFARTAFPPLPSALVLDGPVRSTMNLSMPIDMPNGNNFGVEGNDHSAIDASTSGLPGCGSNDADKPAIGVIDGISNVVTQNGIPTNRLDHYTGVDGYTPDIKTLPFSQLSGVLTVDKLESLLAMLGEAADQTYNPAPGTAATPGYLGADSDPKITFVNGNCTLGAGSARNGNGILVVTGDFNTDGQFSFNGIIIVVGQGTWYSNGGGSGQINGQILVAKTRDGEGNKLSAIGEPIFDWSGGGGNGIYYNSCWVKNAIRQLGYTTLSFHELMY